MSSSFNYSTPVSPSRSPLQRKFDDERRYKERIAQIKEKNKECEIRRKMLDTTFKEALGHEKKQSENNDNERSLFKSNEDGNQQEPTPDDDNNNAESS